MKIRTIAIFAGIALLAVAGAFALPVMMTAAIFSPGPKAPTDEAMISHWEKHRKTLDDITDMLRRDPALNRLGMTWSDPDDPARAHVPPERIADYRDLMREAASIISISRGHRSVQFLFHASGLAVSGFVLSGERLRACIFRHVYKRPVYSLRRRRAYRRHLCIIERCTASFYRIEFASLELGAPSCIVKPPATPKRKPTSLLGRKHAFPRARRQSVQMLLF